MLVDLSHRITDGMITYPGLPAPVIGTHLSREAAEELYGPGITFHIGLLTMCTNTGTYIDVPFHRYADGHDLADLALEKVAGLRAVVSTSGVETIEVTSDELSELEGHAVLVRTDHSEHFGTDRYFRSTRTERLVRRRTRRRRRRVRRHRLAEHRRHEDRRATGAFDPPEGRDPYRRASHQSGLVTRPGLRVLSGAAEDRRRRDVHRSSVRSDLTDGNNGPGMTRRFDGTGAF